MLIQKHVKTSFFIATFYFDKILVEAYGRMGSPGCFAIFCSIKKLKRKTRDNNNPTKLCIKHNLSKDNLMMY